MNILLIRGKPTYTDMIVGIPTGLVSVAPMAQKRDHHVEILDLALEEDPDPILYGKLKERKWNLVGLSCMTAEFEGTEMTARKVKGFDQEIQVIFGGQHPTMVTEEVLSQPYCDFVCVGRGRKPLVTFWMCLLPLKTSLRFRALPGRMKVGKSGGIHLVLPSRMWMRFLCRSITFSTWIAM